MTSAGNDNPIGIGTKTLVTGGGGFLGGAIVRLLTARGAAVTSFSRRRHGALDEIGVGQIQGDLADSEAVAGACEGKVLVFHTAAKPPPWGRVADYRRTNVHGTRNVLDACRRNGVRALIYTSTPSVVFTGKDLEGVDESAPYPKRFMSPYAETKATAEILVRSAASDGLPAVILRPHEIWGPGDPHIVPRIIAKAKRLRRIGSGRNLVDTLYIDNAADAHLLAAARLLQEPELSGRVYFISQDEPVPFWDIVDEVLKAARMDPIKGRVPYPMAWMVGALCEGVWRALALGGEPFLTRFLANASARSHWFDISAAKRDLGYRPAVSTREGMRRLAAWLEAKRKGEEDAR